MLMLKTKHGASKGLTMKGKQVALLKAQKQTFFKPSAHFLFPEAYFLFSLDWVTQKSKVHTSNLHNI